MASIELPSRLWERLVRHAEVRQTTPEDLAVRAIDLFLNDVEAKSEINDAMAPLRRAFLISSRRKSRTSSLNPPSARNIGRMTLWTIRFPSFKE